MEHYWRKDETIPERVLYPYPHPKSIGLVLNPKHAARVHDIMSESPADVAGLEAGDDILTMSGQPLISMADVQWVLHHLPEDSTTVNLTIRRSDKTKSLSIKLPAHWRRNGDTSWRTGHWILRRSMLGGMKLNVPTGGQPLRVEYVGNWGPFGVAHRAGVQKGDVLESVDGVTGLKKESEVFDYLNENKKPGQSVQLGLRRNGERHSVRFRID